MNVEKLLGISEQGKFERFRLLILKKLAANPAGIEAEHLMDEVLHDARSTYAIIGAMEARKMSQEIREQRANLVKSSSVGVVSGGRKYASINEYSIAKIERRATAEMQHVITEKGQQELASLEETLATQKHAQTLPEDIRVPLIKIITAIGKATEPTTQEVKIIQLLHEAGALPTQEQTSASEEKQIRLVRFMESLIKVTDPEKQEVRIIELLRELEGKQPRKVVWGRDT